MLDLGSKIYSIILVGLLGLSAILYLLFAAEIVSHGLLINWCFALFGVAALASIIFPIVGMVKDFKKSVTSLIGVGALILIFVIGYFLSTDEAYTIGERVVEGSLSQRSEAGLITFYVMILLAIATIVYVEVSKMIK